MGEKTVLISSMQKLINHIRKSQANQQEIFYSLSRTDFKKILSNLEDENLLLRKTSLNLIAELLSSNSKLKTKFCQTMQINLIPGKILFNTKTLEKQTNPISFKNILTLLKKEGYTNQKDCLLWYINTRVTGTQLQLQFIERDKSKQQMQIDIDPQECIVGFCLTHSDLSPQYSTSNLSLPITDASQSNKMQLKSLIEPNPKKVISIVGSKISSTMSDSQPRYQRNNKSYQLDTDRPKKFINTFLQQRKLNARGAQTQRHHTVNYELSPIMPTQPSVQLKTQQYQTSRSQYEKGKRSQQSVKQQNQVLRQSNQFSKDINRFTMMPKTSQSPYIPTLNLQNSGHNYAYRTERPGQSYMSSKNQSKEMDFHKIKYQQGIKITTNPANRSSLGNPIIRNQTERNHPSMYSNPISHEPTYLIPGMGVTAQMNGKKQLQNSFQFKYIKPMTTTHTQTIKNVNFFHKPNKDQPFNDKKTIDIFQFIKNK